MRPLAPAGMDLVPCSSLLGSGQDHPAALYIHVHEQANGGEGVRIPYRAALIARAQEGREREESEGKWQLGEQRPYGQKRWHVLL